MVTTAPAHADFLADFERLYGLASSPVASADELVLLLKRIYNEVYERDLARYARSDVQAAASHLLRRMFLLRTTLRDRIPEWERAGLMARPAQRALRDALRVLRYATDMLGEVNNNYAFADAQDQPLRAFTGNDYNTLVHPAFDTGENVTFCSGDILLVRGMAHNSAAIARIGDIDSQFSHAYMVYIDETGRHWAVEALIEVGACITPLKDTLAHGVGRAVLYRPHDANLAAKAAQLIHAHVKRSLERGGTTILYDFTMRLHNYNRLFCSKLVRLAFDDASDGRLMLPTYTTRLDAKNRDFFKRVGVKTEETFAPGDLEIEPKIDLVAEWQDYRFTSRMRTQDLIMTKIFEWMDAFDYRFKEGFRIRLISLFGRLSTKFSRTIRDLIAQVVPRIPVNMSRRAIGTIAMLHETAEPILEEVSRLDRLTVTTEGRPLHPREVFDWMESYRRRQGGRFGYLVAGK